MWDSPIEGLEGPDCLPWFDVHFVGPSFCALMVIYVGPGSLWVHAHVFPCHNTALSTGKDISHSSRMRCVCRRTSMRIMTSRP